MSNDNLEIDSLGDEVPAGGAGFEREGHSDQNQRNNSDRSSFKRNLTTVFGSGIGRISIIIVGIVIVCVLALAYRGLSKPAVIAADNSKVDLPKSPRTDKSAIDPVTQSELVRRSEQSSREAAEKAQSGGTYQPAFDPNVIKDGESVSTINKRSVVAGETGFNVEETSDKAKFSAESSGLSVNQQVAKTNKQSQQIDQKEIQRQQKLDQEYALKLKEREQYIRDIRKQISDQAQAIIGVPDNQTSVSNPGTYGRAVYYTESTEKEEIADDIEVDSSPIKTQDSLSSSSDRTSGHSGKNTRGKVLIKTGNILYAELDSEVNTDDGSDVFATIRGGEWDGSKLIGRISKETDNISLKFTIMAPQDDRPTMPINAMALREEDAKLGVAENIDRHVLSRYGSLAVSSLLSGYGRAYSQSGQQTTVLPGGGYLISGTDPTTKKVVAQAVGEMGTALSSEVRKNFNRPTTYSTPAKQGLGIFFIADVVSQKN